MHCWLLLLFEKLVKIDVNPSLSIIVNIENIRSDRRQRLTFFFDPIAVLRKVRFNRLSDSFLVNQMRTIARACSCLYLARQIYIPAQRLYKYTQPDEK